TLEVEQIRDSVRRDAGAIAAAGSGVRGYRGRNQVISRLHSQKHACPRPAVGVRPVPGSLERLPRHLTGKTLLMVHPRRLLRRDTEKQGIEVSDPFQEARP